MRKRLNIMLGIWCFLTSLITPIWLTLVCLNITGKIYDYDYSMDIGTALIIGVFMLALWVLFALLPDIIFVEHMYRMNRRYAYIAVISVFVICLLSIAICRWNIVEFLKLVGFLA